MEIFVIVNNECANELGRLKSIIIIVIGYTM